MPKKLVACEVGPNYQFKDGLIAGLSLLNIFNLGQKKAKKQNLEFFRKYFKLNKKEQVVLTDSGRTSLFLLLTSLKKTLNLTEQNQVMIQAFSCIVLPNSIWQAGLKPVLLDVDLPDFLDAEKKSKIGYNINLTNLKKKVNSKTKVLILQYTFGLVPENLQEVLDFCKENKVIVIEDIAHSLGADFQNQKIGSLGQASFFSFGRDKIISTTIGGGGFINSQNSCLDKKTQQKWQENLNLEYQKLREMSFKRVFQSLAYPVLITFLIRPFYHLQIGKAILAISRKLKLIGEVYTDKEKVGTNQLETASKYPTKFNWLLQNQLNKLEKYNQHRKKIAQLYAQELGLKYSKNSVYMRFPISFKDKEKYFEIKQKLRQKGVIVGTWYNSLFLPKLDYKEKFGYQAGDLKNVEFLSQNRTLNLATNIYVSDKLARMQVGVLKGLVKIKI